MALALKAAGHTVMLAHYSRFDPRQQYDVIVFHRPRYSLGFRFTLRQLRKQGSRCIADFDDLVFDPAWASYSPGVLNQQVSLKQTVRNFTAHDKALRLFDEVTVSTTPLQDKIQQSHGLKAVFVPNAVHLGWRAEPAPGKEPVPRLTYFPGTRSHDRDFAHIHQPLADFLHDHAEVELHITGTLSEDVLIKTRPHQLVCHPAQPFQSYRQHVAQSWLNLAPLENTVFNQHKSALKVIEASYFNAPTLASPIPDMQRLESAGAILAANQNDWFDGLSRVFGQSSDNMLQLRILNYADAHNIAHQWMHALELEQTPGP